jgi:hypothetical protein
MKKRKALALISRIKKIIHLIKPFWNKIKTLFINLKKKLKNLMLKKINMKKKLKINSKMKKNINSKFKNLCRKIKKLIVNKEGGISKQKKINYFFLNYNII